MAHFIDSPLESGISLLTVSNKITKPQDGFVFRPMVGVDKDGVTVRVVDMEAEFKDTYLVLFFFPMDFKVDSSEVLSFKKHLDEFTENNCEIVGVTSDNPLAVKRWISKDVSRGGFGGPVGFPILTDKDLSLSMSMGVARDCGLPARATFIIDWTGSVRYMMVHRSDIGRSVKEILRLVQAFRHSDLTGEALASGWTPGGEVIPTDFSEKVKYFVDKFGQGKNEEITSDSVVENVDDATETPRGESSSVPDPAKKDAEPTEEISDKGSGSPEPETTKSKESNSGVEKSPVMSPAASASVSVKSLKSVVSAGKASAKSAGSGSKKTPLKPASTAASTAEAIAEDEKKV